MLIADLDSVTMLDSALYGHPTSPPPHAIVDEFWLKRHSKEDLVSAVCLPVTDER
jgi:hypothetical protein